MKTMQNKILDKIEAVIEAAGLDPSITYEWPNIGSIYIQRKTDLTPFAYVSFNFQGSYYTTRIKWNGAWVNSQIGRQGYYDFLQDYDKPTSFWEQLAQLLTTEAPRKPRLISKGPK